MGQAKVNAAIREQHKAEFEAYWKTETYSYAVHYDPTDYEWSVMKQVAMRAWCKAKGIELIKDA